MKTCVIVAAAAALNFCVLPQHVVAQDGNSQVVINEIHYDEADKTLRGEFIELHNAGATDVDVSGWFFAEGVDFTFPSGTIIPSAGYVVVAESPEVIAELYNGLATLGPWAGSLKNSGETIVLRDAAGKKVDEVSYRIGYPWPTTGEDPSPSIELMNPSLDNDLGGSWRASGNAPASPEMTFMERAANWQYWKGNQAPALDGEGRDWMDPDYAASGWPSGQTPIGIGDDDDNTVLDDMQSNYVAIIARHTFELPEGPLPSTLELELYFDDGVVALLNGNEIARESVDPDWEVSHDAPGGTASSHEAPSSGYEAQVIRGAQGYLRVGTNVLTLVGLNSSIGGSDFSLDGSLRSVQPDPDDLLTDPSPGKPNSVLADNAPPQSRQVEHSPVSPKSGEPVTVSAKVTDPDGVAAVTLSYQLVNPGDYIAVSDERYASEWTEMPMTVAAGTDIYSAVLPGDMQTHRRLIRYRITVTDVPGAAVMVPYIEDPQPNFAYFVYDSVPAYTGSATNSTEPVTYAPELLNTLPIYQFITTREHHEDALHIPDGSGGGYGGSDYRWEGTMVYDGKVYDHIRFRARGGVWRYAMGKNMWKFDFNRGHRFQARDNYGRKYKTEWDKLNFSACIQQGDFNHRGEQGLFESTGFKLFNLAGVEAPLTNFVHYRVIDREAENGDPESQFDTDFQGLYLTIEQLDGRFLDEHGLTDGNLYKIEGYNGDSNNQGPTQVSNRSDVRDFIAGFRNRTPDPEWWRANLDVERALSYHSITEAIHHYDIAYGKNYFYYHNPDTGLFQVHPWDLDLTWADNMFGNGQHNILQKLCKRDPFNVDYQNRMREIQDLLYNPEQTGMLIDEMAGFVHQPGQPSFVDADRAMWDYNPILRSRFVNANKAGHGRFYREGVGGRTFEGMINHMKEYVESRGAWLVRTYLKNEDAIPRKPEITYSGMAGYPPDGLQFQTSAFSSPEGARFAGMKWRVAEVTDPTIEGFNPYDRVTPRIYEIESTWESEIMDIFAETLAVPALETRPGRTYRARVRHLDSEGRWSHWSDPLQFVAGDPDIAAFQAQLVVAELMYNPSPPTTAAELAVTDRNSDFEYLVLQNIGATPLDLTNVRLTKGVDFDFAAGTVLGAGEKVFVVKNLAAFTARYGAQAGTVTIAGEWDSNDNLNDAGENLRVAYGAGSVIREFNYSDGAPWPESADGAGYSLVLADTAQLIDPAEASSWNASPNRNGSLGNVEVDSGYAAWKARFGVTSDGSDTDLDGTPALVEYALRQSPRVADPSALVATTDPTGAFLEVAFRWDTLATDASFALRTSSDLTSWSNAAADRFALINEVDLGEGVVRRVYRDTVPSAQAGTEFVQLQVSIGQ